MRFASRRLDRSGRRVGRCVRCWHKLPLLLGRHVTELSVAGTASTRPAPRGRRSVADRSHRVDQCHFQPGRAYRATVAQQHSSPGSAKRWSRRFLRLGLASSIALIAVLGASVGLAAASKGANRTVYKSSANGIAVAVGINSAKITSNGGPGGSCTWLVDSTVTVVNLTNSAVTVANENGPDGNVIWSDSGNSGVVTPNVVMTWPNSAGGFGTVPANSSLDGTADATFTIPCNATDGQLDLNFHVTQGTQQLTLSGDAPFLQNGTSVPVLIGIGSLGASAVLGGALLWRMRRRPQSSPAAAA